MRRKGSAIMIAMILGTAFFIAVSALLRHSSGEMRHVRAVSAVKKAEMLAMSGIDWAESELRVGRWYGSDFVPYEKNKGKHATYGKKILTPFGSGEGEVKVICEDVANKVPGNNMHGMQELWFLHHINVYALGKYEGQQCLIYGRYIISPEPILNSKSTDGAEFASPEHGGVPGAIGVSASKTKVNDEEISEFIVKEIKVSEHDSVDANSIIAVLNPIYDSDIDIEVRPHTYGTVAEIKINPGETCRAGDNLLLLTKTLDAEGNNVAMKTLKKMVRVTKIPFEIWQNLDIEDRNDRYALAQYISGISDAYLQNFVAHAALEDALKVKGNKKLGKRINTAEMLNAFPAHLTSTTRNRAENTFLAHMIRNFTAPSGTWDKKEQALNKTFLKLDHPKSTQPPQELVNWLKDLSLEEVLKTKPRRDSRYFEPKMRKNEFMELLRPHLNQPSSEFIKSLSQLPDASRLIKIEEGNFGNSEIYNESVKGIEIVKPDKGVKVSVEKLTKSYSFVDPESGFAIEMQDLMAFLKKYYDDEVCQSPREEVRTNEHTDWPLPAPAPPPPAPVPGGRWVWIEGTPGVPPGKPTYEDKAGRVKKINYPTAGPGVYIPPIPGDLDGGIEEWKIDGVPPTDGNNQEGENAENQNNQNDEFPIKICDCDGSVCSKCDPEGKAKIAVNLDSDWKVIPGKPGIDPSQGKYIWQPDPPPPPPGPENDPDSNGNGSGGGNEDSSGSGGIGGSGGTPDSNNSSGGPDGSPVPPSPPPSPPRSVSGAC